MKRLGQVLASSILGYRIRRGGWCALLRLGFGLLSSGGGTTKSRIRWITDFCPTLSYLYLLCPFGYGRINKKDGVRPWSCFKLTTVIGQNSRLGMRTFKTRIAVLLCYYFGIFGWRDIRSRTLTAVFSLRRELWWSVPSGLHVMEQQYPGILCRCSSIPKTIFHRDVLGDSDFVPLRPYCHWPNIAIERQRQGIGEETGNQYLLSIP